MEVDVGSADRIVHIVLGIALILFALFSESPYRWSGLLAIVPLATGFLRWCPAYLPFGIRTFKTQ